MAEEYSLIEITCSLDMSAMGWKEILKQGKYGCLITVCITDDYHKLTEL